MSTVNESIKRYDITHNTGTFTVDLPKGSKILSVTCYNYESTFWVIVNRDEKQLETRTFTCWRRGNIPVTDYDQLFIGTVILWAENADEDDEDYHYFEVIKK